MENRINKYLRAPVEKDELDLFILEKELIVRQILKEETDHLTPRTQERIKRDLIENSIRECQRNVDTPDYFEDGVFDRQILKIVKKLVKKHTSHL